MAARENAGRTGVGGQEAQRVDLGGIEVIGLLDAEGTFATYGEAFPCLPASVEAAARRRHPDLFAGTSWRLPFRAFVARSAETTVLIDAGLGRSGGLLETPQAWLPRSLRLAGLDPAGIDIVVLTHTHIDHVGWVVDDRGPLCPHAEHVVTSAEWQLASARKHSSSAVRRLSRLLERGAVRLVPHSECVLTPRVRLVPTPGHTPGHASVRIEGDVTDAVVLGDVAVHPLQVLDPDVAYTYEADQAASATTRRRILDQLSDEHAIVAAGHFDECFGYVERQGAAFAWTPLSARSDPDNLSRAHPIWRRRRADSSP